MFQVMCFLLATYFTVIFIHRFGLDANATSIAYKKYHETTEDKYPDFSFCFKGPSIHWYNDIEIFKSYEVSPAQYELMLRGETGYRYRYDYGSKLFRKIPVNINDKHDPNFSSYHLNVSDIILATDFITDTFSHEGLNENIKDESSLDVPHDYANENILDKLSMDGHKMSIKMKESYQMSDKICFTRESHYGRGLTRRIDNVVLDRTILDNKKFQDAEMEIFIHYPGQLLKSLDNPSFSTAFKKYKEGKLLEFKLNRDTVLRKRSISTKPCNMDISNYDMYFQEAVSNEAQCIPPFWKYIYDGGSNHKECTSPALLQKIHNLATGNKKMSSNFDEPRIP